MFGGFGINIDEMLGETVEYRLVVTLGNAVVVDQNIKAPYQIAYAQAQKFVAEASQRQEPMKVEVIAQLWIEDPSLERGGEFKPYSIEYENNAFLRVVGGTPS